MNNEIEQLAALVEDLKGRQAEMELEIISLGNRMQTAVTSMIDHPDMTEEMKDELVVLMAGMQLAILELQGKAPH